MSTPDTRTVRTYSLDEQEAIVRGSYPASKFRLMAKIHREADYLLELGIRRMRTLGAAEYGDRLFHLDIEAIDAEVDQELADAFVYEGPYVLLDKKRKGL